MMIAIVAVLALAMSASGDVNQSAIDDVKSGKLTEARAAWWGFDSADSTKSIQNAINSGAQRVIIEDMGRPWIVVPLFAASDQELVFETGVVLQAKKGEFKGGNDSRLSVLNKTNVTITGYGATCRMKPGEGVPGTPAVLFMSRAGDQKDVGGVHFEHCVVDDPQQRPVMGFHDGAGDLRLVDVTGTFEILAGERKSDLELTSDWLNKLHRGNTF